ncbi:hypothetical protein BGZ70_003373, partial [Mortierella alpina]
MDFAKNAFAAYQQHANKGDDEKDQPTKTQQSTQESAPQSSVTPPSLEELQKAKDAHAKVYGQENSKEATEEELGNAAAVEAFNKYEEEEEEDESA